MKINIEIECTPEEARSFMGLPDVSKANSVYIDALTGAMKGTNSPDQMQEYMKAVAPMGQVGLQLFQSFVEGGLRTGSTSGSRARGPAGEDASD